uniref:DUF4258 domain-containing protein n=1 Tax=Candidatus Methanophagaceae archaeon ANME-1 ERB6 TaxID=2759912 RepID=A0A7G9YWW9_9EURY|nr:hypothetical protein CGEPLDJD_00023 [Methanosarcinales archaeon ANME-1 ERB6]
MDYDKIKKLTKEKKILITDHAWEAIDKREISTKEVISVILNGEIIEEYKEDKPCPSSLILGFVGSRSIHVLVALCKEHIRIITTYEPDAAKWVDYRFRKKEGK